MNKKLLTSLLLMGLVAGCAGNSNSTSQSGDNSSTSSNSSANTESSKISSTSNLTNTSSSTTSNTSSSTNTSSYDKVTTSSNLTSDNNSNSSVTSSNTSSSVKDEPVVEYNATVYYYNSNGWTNVNCYSWDGNGTTLFGEWPGSAMTPVEGKENWYEATFAGGESFNVIFNNGSAQTPDTLATSTNKYFYGSATQAFSSFEAVEEAMQTAPDTEITIYFANSVSWSTVYCYAWLGSVQNGGWPGVEMTYVVDNIYSYTLDTALYGNIIFGDGSSQTVDISLSDVTNNTLFSLEDNSSGKWTCTTSLYEG